MKVSHAPERPGRDGLGYGKCKVCGQLWPCEASRSTLPYVPAPIPADPERDARVAARRAADARKAGRALDRLIQERGGRDYGEWGRDLATDLVGEFADLVASRLQHNCHYVITPDDVSDHAKGNVRPDEPDPDPSSGDLG